MARFVIRWFALTALLLLAVAAFNFVVDPYGIFRWVDKPAFNAVKPTATTRGGMAKAYGVFRELPAGLVLGNSRAEVGFDPRHPGWPKQAQPAFNLSIAATGPTTTLRYFQHALAANGRPPSTVVWGIDFMDFLVDAHTSHGPDAPTQEEQRLLQSPAELRGLKYGLHQIKDAAESTLTLRALLDSIQTVAARRDPFAMDQTALGFNPMRDYRKIAAEQGYWALFRQKDLAYVQNFVRRPKSIFDASGRSSHELEAARTLLRLCRERGIALHLVMYPYHAHFQEAFRIAGHWQAFDDWKRAVVRMVAEEARAAHQPAFVVWDFTGFNEWTSEAIPPRGDRSTPMKWYWEAGHFKRELGDLVLDAVWNPDSVRHEFGLRIDESNVEAQIIKVRREEANYRQTHEPEIAELEDMAIQARQALRNAPAKIAR